MSEEQEAQGGLLSCAISPRAAFCAPRLAITFQVGAEERRTKPHGPQAARSRQRAQA